MLTLPQPAQHIINTLKDHGFEGYAVGGSVRDLLLNRSTKSWDFTTNATPAHILEIFPDSFYDNQFGTVGVKIRPKDTSGMADKQELHRGGEKEETSHHEVEDIYEITTYRSERGYKDHRHPDEVIWGEKLEEDLARRDFTINAIAFDGKTLVDPFKGQEDLKNKSIRAVGDPEKRFNEDALRLLRAIRIATELGFTIEEHTFTVIKKLAPFITQVSHDRIRNELMKIIKSEFPADGVMLLKNSGLLVEILPELEKCFGVPQQSPKRHHIYDVGTHLVKSLQHCPSKDPVVRFATLVHDIGKPVVFRKGDKTGLITFYNHEMVGASIVKNIASRLNFSKKDREKLVTLTRWHQFTVDESQTDSALRRFIRRVGKENLQDIIDLRIGDRLGGGARETSWRLRLFLKRLKEVQKQPFTVADLKVNGHDVMKIFGIPPGPTIGHTLNELFNEVVMEKVKNEREILLARLEEMKRVSQTDS